MLQIAPSDILRSEPGGDWVARATLTEMAGYAVKVAGLTIGDIDYTSQISSIFGSDSIAPFGSLTGLLTIPGDRSAGQYSINISTLDIGSGQTGAVSSSVTTENNSSSLVLALSDHPAAATFNPADPACTWLEHVVLENFGAAPATISPQAAPLAIFTSRYIAPYGAVQGDICRTNQISPVVSDSLTVLDNVGAQTSVSVSGSGFPDSPSPSALSASPPAIEWSTDLSETTQIHVDPGTSNGPWSIATVFTEGPGGWLSTSSPNGTGPSDISLSVDASKMPAAGSYHALLIIEAPLAKPRFLTVPVTVRVPSSGIGLVNSASYLYDAAPGSILSLFRADALASGVAVPPGLPLSRSLAGFSATINGVAAPLYYVSPQQVNLQIPYGASPGAATLMLNTASGTKDIPIHISATAPGIFLDSDFHHFAPKTAVHAGDYATLYFTGQGPVSPPVATGDAPPPPDQVSVSGLPSPFGAVKVLVNGMEATISFAGIPYYLVGVAQINFIVPPGTPAGDQAVVVSVGGVSSNTAYLTVLP
jgi:uncharacterized protein (TIGR03437 family)